MALDPDTFDALIGTIRRFVAERLRPLEERVAEEDEVPGDVVREMREMGLFGLSIPEEFGGLGLTMSEEVRVALGVRADHAGFPLRLRHQCRDRQPGPRHGRLGRAEGRVAPADSQRREEAVCFRLL
jgi:alkylation response protein AidB-like acyl-CoA dehydrogenase